MAFEARLYFSVGNRSPQNAEEAVQQFAVDLKATWAGEAVQVAGALREYLEHVAAVLAERHGKSWPATTGKSLSKRTGTAVDSIVHSVKVEGTTWSDLTGAIGGVDYLTVHEFGGTISGRGKMLAIPLPAALNSNGTPIKPNARDWQDTFVARSKAGNLIIFQRRANRIVPLYVLKDTVKIPPRLGMADTLGEQIPYFLSKAADLVVNDVTKQLGGGA